MRRVTLLFVCSALCGLVEGCGQGSAVLSWRIRLVLPPPPTMPRPCGIDNRRACDAEVIALARSPAGVPRLSELRAVLQRQCQTQIAESCIGLAQMQRDGLGGARDWPAALRSLFHARALRREDCEQGWERACKGARLSWWEWHFFRLERGGAEPFLRWLIETRRPVSRRTWTEWVDFVRRRGIPRALVPLPLLSEPVQKPLAVRFVLLHWGVQPLPAGDEETFDADTYEWIQVIWGPGPHTTCFGTLSVPHLFVVRPAITAPLEPRRHVWPPRR